MELVVQNWEVLYRRIEEQIQDPFDLYVLSDYEDLGGTFLLVSSRFSSICLKSRRKWLSNILKNFPLVKGNVLTPEEFLLACSKYEFISSMETYTIKSA